MKHFKCSKCGKTWHSEVPLKYKKDKTCSRCGGELEEIDEDPTTESLQKRGREVQENGVVEGKIWPAIVGGICGVGVGLTILLVYFF